MNSLTLKPLFFSVFITFLSLWLTACDSSDSDSSCSVNGDTDGHLLRCGELDIAVDGEGYFIVSDNSGGSFYSRSVTLNIEDEQLLTAEGYKVNGFLSVGNMRVGGTPVAIDLGDVEITTVDIDEAGVISAQVSGTTTVIAQIALAKFIAPYFLEESVEGVYSQTAASGEPVVGTAGSGELGALAVGDVEVEAIDNAFDLSVSGDGYFVLDNQVEEIYAQNIRLAKTLSGSLALLDTEPEDAYQPQAYLADSNGDITNIIDDLLFPLSDLAPQQTAAVALEVNLDSRSGLPAATPFNALDSTSFTHQFSVDIYDSRGQSHTLNLYFVNTAAAGVWQLYLYIADDNGTPQNVIAIGSGYFEVTFSAEGALETTVPTELTVDGWNPEGAAQSSSSGATADVSDFSVSLDGSTEAGSDFAAQSVEQDGFASGSLVSLEFDSCGLFYASYSNGETMVLGQSALAVFAAPSALASAGDGLFQATAESGAADYGVACETDFGEITGDIINP
ncbi:flagellar hook-basal body complex protein [Oceanicoccus sagamiensis]|uniref:Uncharacterized protein n=1 Tax=Oceanicoccus sagamiensis TaxID=716816 RepID=A0A1X9NFP3_9GAMM|nr:flagellar hook-basal body complex protein [Oceanicoccus sagamiensis]ARN75242.1 hypothetical protein BST96_14630 [Oceanicoccus sagamiensis]